MRHGSVRTRASLARRLVVALVVTLAGCGGSDDDDASAGGVPDPDAVARTVTLMEAEDAAALRGAFSSPEPDVVLLDLKLPDGEGLELLPEVKKQWPNTEVIILTGHASIDAAVSASRTRDKARLDEPRLRARSRASVNRQKRHGRHAGHSRHAGVHRRAHLGRRGRLHSRLSGHLRFGRLIPRARSQRERKRRQDQSAFQHSFLQW